MFSNVNWIGIIAAAISNMVIGYVWYGVLFGKAWMKLVGITKADMEAGKKEMPKTYGLMFVSAIVTAFVLQMFIVKTSTVGIMGGAIVGFWAWLGFVAMVKFGDVLFEKKPVNLFYIEIGFQLVALLVAGGILAALG